MRICNCGDIFWVDFAGSVGHEYQGRRPAIVIQCDASLASSNVVTVMPLSAKVEKKRPDDVFVTKDSTNNLYADSVVRVCHISTFDRARLVKKVGLVNGETMDQIRRYLIKHFGIEED